MARDDLYRELHRVLASTYDFVGSLKEPHPKYKWAVKYTRADHAKFQAKELRIFELIRELRLFEFVPYDEHSQDSPYPTLGLGSEEHIHPDAASTWMREMSQLRDVVANYVADLADESPNATHSPDFRSAFWHGTEHSFTPTQSAVVRILWDAWENKTPEVGEAYILSELDEIDVSDNKRRIRDIFKGNPAWGTMIQAGGTRGTHRLVAP